METTNKIIIHINDRPIVIQYVEFDDFINLEELTSIDYSNIYGEAVTISTLLSKLGIMRSDAESLLNNRKLDHEIYEAKRRKSLRKEASKNLGKLLIDEQWVKITEKALDEIIISDPDWLVKKKSVIEAKKQYDYIDAIFWAASSKDKKLNNIVKAVTPQEFYSDLVEGAINGMIISKGKIRH